jgi:hypothetical protein
MSVLIGDQQRRWIGDQQRRWIAHEPNNFLHGDGEPSLALKGLRDERYLGYLRRVDLLQGSATVP